MRDYTYIDGARFLIHTIYRSQRFDVDRLDINSVGELKPDLLRGLRVVDHLAGETHTVHGEQADNLVYSLAAISCTKDGASYEGYDTYLLQATQSGIYAFDENEPPEGVIH